MGKEYSRREFLKMMGIGAASVAVGTSLVGCKEGEEQKMALDRLSEYHVFKQHISELDYDDYFFIREQRYLDNYMYLYLNVAEDKYFYDNVYVTLRDEYDHMDLDNGLEHIQFAPLLDNFDMEDLGNAVVVVSEQLGEKSYYTASEINRVPELLQQRTKDKTLVKTR